MAAKKAAATKPAAKAKADKAKQAEPPAEAEFHTDDDELSEAQETLTRMGFKADNLVGQLADYLIENARTERKPWSHLTQAQQESIIENAQRRARWLIADIVKAIANRGLNYMEATLEGGSFKLGDGALKLKAVVDFTPEHAEFLAQGSIKAVLVLASLREFDGEASVKSVPDQPSLEDAAAENDDEEAEEAAHDPETGELLDDDGDDEAATPMQDMDEETEANARRRAP